MRVKPQWVDLGSNSCFQGHSTYHTMRFGYPDGHVESVDLKQTPMNEVIHDYGELLTKDAFNDLKKSLPELIKTIEERWKEHRAQEKARRAAIHTEREIENVSVSDICNKTNPCKHTVILNLHGGETLSFPRALSAKKIAEKYAGLLDIFKIMHFRKHVPAALEEVIQIKMTALIENLDTVHLNRQSEITGLLLRYKDGSAKTLECRDPREIIKYFGTFLDEESLIDPDIKSAIYF